VLDEVELTRVSNLARTELEDARIELERASKLAKAMGKDIELDDEDDQWEELSSPFLHTCGACL
jgi:periodic tryptophan protein 1